MIYIGSHLSAAKGYEAMGRQALKLGADTFAFFTRNPRGGSMKVLNVEDMPVAQNRRYGSLPKRHSGKTWRDWNTFREIIITFIREAMWDRAVKKAFG